MAHEKARETLPSQLSHLEETGMCLIPQIPRKWAKVWPCIPSGRLMDFELACGTK